MVSGKKRNFGGRHDIVALFVVIEQVSKLITNTNQEEYDVGETRFYEYSADSRCSKGL